MSLKESYDELKNNRILRVLFLILFASVIVGILFIFRFYFWHLFWAFILYFGLIPVRNLIEAYIKNRALNSLVVISLMLILAIVPFFYLLIVVANQSFQLYMYLQNSFDISVIKELISNDRVVEILSMLNMDEAELYQRAVKFVETKSLQAFSSVTAIIAYPVTFSLNFLFMLLMLFFLMNNGHKLSRLFYMFLPFPDDIEKQVVNRLKEVIKVLLAGNLLIMSLQGLMVGLGLYIAGFSMGILGGSVSAVLSLIPVIGTAMIWLPGVIYLLIQGSYPMALFFGIWCLAWYLILENLLKPQIMGERLNFHPLIFFFLLLGSIQAFGLPGVIIGPILLTLFYSLLEIYRVITGIETVQEAAAENTDELADTPEE
jgi:predicted PurR-regulated permease PerM